MAENKKEENKERKKTRDEEERTAKENAGREAKRQEADKGKLDAELQKLESEKLRLLGKAEEASKKGASNAEMKRIGREIKKLSRQQGAHISESSLSPREKAGLLRSTKYSTNAALAGKHPSMKKPPEIDRQHAKYLVQKPKVTLALFMFIILLFACAFVAYMYFGNKPWA